MSFGYHPSGLPLWAILAMVAPILLAQGTWLFLDARKRGARAWLWGLYGLIQCPCPLILYYFLVIRKPKA